MEKKDPEQEISELLQAYGTYFSYQGEPGNHEAILEEIAANPSISLVKKALRLGVREDKVKRSFIQGLEMGIDVYTQSGLPKEAAVYKQALKKLGGAGGLRAYIKSGKL